MGISAWNKKMVWGHFISDIIDSDVLKILLWTREVFSAYVLVWKTKTFSYTWADQVFEVPEDCNMTIECWGAWSNNASWWYAKWVIPVTKWQKLSFMIWWNWGRTNNWTTYWFGWSTTYGWRWWWGLSWAFTWDTAIGANDASRVLVIAWWAWGGRTWGWAWGWTTWQNWNGGSFWYPWAWGTQTWRWSWGNTRSEQFRWGGWSWTYWFGWGWWWRWGNGSWWNGSWDDDAQAGWGSGHVVSTATDIVLTQWGWSAAWQDWSVKIRYLVKEKPQPIPTARLPHEYQEVEYIEGNGTQRIDLLTTPTSNTKVQFKFMPKWWTWWTALWYYTWNDNTDWRFFTSYWSTSAIYTDHPWRPVFDFNSSRLEWPDNTFALNTVYELEMWNYYLKYLDWANILTWNQISGFTWTTTIKLDYSYSVSTQASNRWYYVKIYESWTLVRDLVPCYRVADWAGWLYDLVEWKFYTNAWTWTFKKWAPVNVWQMPEGYTELQYIQSSWASNTDWQYVDTWYMPNNNTEFELSMSNWSNASWSFQLFWQDTNRTTWDKWTSVVTDNYSWNWPNANTFTHWFRDWNFHLLLLNNSWLYRDWTLVHSWRAGQTFQSSVTCAIFCLHRGTSYIERSSYRFHYMRIRENWDVKRDYVPCVRDSDGVLWLYDLITNTFLTNQWTWSFVAWPVVFRDGFKVSPNTMLYTPMDTDLSDHSLNERSITNVWITLDTSILQNKWVWYFRWNADYGLQFTWAEFWNNDFTISWREKTLQNSTGAWSRFSSAWDASSWCWVLVWYNHTYLYAWTWWSSRNIVNGSQIFNSTPNTRVHRVLVKEWSNWKTYRNNVLFGSASGSWSVWYNISVIWNYRPWDMNPFHWYMSDFILEKKAWTDQQREDYFNATKALYWVS